ncbi:hypothetical protein BU24DRAFT_490477 [Aaosphaeria arxii CBS 175.79]|uniref:Uncharacterized protein n=1 Tax=Aaosphaeria arxii CBS 175.79 TaxID=1450172 RepID=A0A6A5XWE6_9PLEO|nr:uncharacterized protein BU24DRAFT_490477 [Aaosphaeria arxii CBS 175.79]KAF2017276.1 hypothetical protein BU24DRAFT_490477 [Aaosphaeria arxii CBS 175.79]
MFGHPGFSALEFAGGEHLTERKTLSLKGKSTVSSTTYDEKISLPAVSIELPGSTSPQLSVQEYGGQPQQQRCRGNFMNHTPRVFEIRSPKLPSFQHSSSETFTDSYTHSHKNSTGDKTSSWSQPWRRTPPTTWEIEHMASLESEGPHELDSKELDLAMDTLPSASAEFHEANSLSSGSRVDQQPNRTSSTSNHHDVDDEEPAITPQQRGKRVRRQTPYKMVIPKANLNSRHSPLEPLVMHHRRQASQATSSSVGEIAPQVEIDDIAEVSTFRALQEYFDSQASGKRSVEASKQSTSSPQPHDIPLPSSPLSGSSSPLAGRACTIPVEELDKLEDTPDIPPRSPKRLEVMWATRTRSASTFSGNSEFQSAAEGQYSPYDKEPPHRHHHHHHGLTVPKKRNQTRMRTSSAARVGSSTLGRMAPPILGHQALTATANLNDLSFYLRNTGPSPEPIKGQRKKSGFRIFKVGGGGKKTLAARVGSVEGSPGKTQQRAARPPMPACARETTTSSGTRHLRIMIPNDDIVQDQTITLPVDCGAGAGGTKPSRHVSITFTDEMLNPLGSSAVENAISPFHAADGGSSDDEGPTATVRSPRTPPKSSTMMPVVGNDHPLASREELTRARKLRDLKKFKQQRGSATTDEDDARAGGAVSSSSLSQYRSVSSSCNSRSALNNSSVGESGAATGEAIQEANMLKQRVIVLQRQNTELAEALARIVGFEAEDGDLDAEAVLTACRRCRTESACSVGIARLGRVFTT